MLWVGIGAATPASPPAIGEVLRESERLRRTSLPERAAYLEAQFAHRAAHPRSDQVRLHLELAHTYFGLLERAKAMNLLRQALTLAPAETDPADARTTALVQLCESQLLSETHQYRPALPLARAAADHFQRADEPLLHARALYELALLHNTLGDYGEGMRCFEEAAALYAAHGNLNAANHVRLVAGERVSVHGMERWIDQILQILQTFEADGDRSGMARAYEFMGYDYDGERAEALRFFRESIRLARETGYKEIERNGLVGLAQILAYDQQAEAAAASLREAAGLIPPEGLNAFDQLHLDRISGVVYTGLGGPENFAKAGDHLGRALAGYERNSDLEAAQLVKENLARLALARGDYAEALRHATEITEWFRGHSRHFLPVGLRLMIRCHLVLDDYRSAYETQRELTRVLEAQWESGNAQQVAMRMKELEIVNRQNEIKLLAQDNELKRQEIERFELKQRQTRQLQLLGSLLGAAMLAIIVVLYLLGQSHRRRLRDSRQSARALEAQNRELEIANTRLKALGEQQKKILRTAAHDLKNPIGSIQNCIEFAREDLQALPPGPAATSVREMVELMGQSATYMQQLVGKTLDYHLSERLASALTLRPLDVAPLVQQMVTLNRSSAKRKHIALHLDLTPLPPVSADSHALREVFDNLLSNAIKYTPPGGTVTVTCAPASSAPGQIDLVIADTGPGIPEHEQARIFDPFNNVSSQPTGGESKNGLGLSIAKTLAESMGGAIRYRNRPGGGAEFTLTLRVSDTPPVA